ncbi:hypothetical protein GCM10008985_04700 [Halococcus dombrowskii]|uniref:Uncharacterized protein n=1 Tax=Halococcus dombrowskii TaxID=179637 RepID=A0AAV3SCS1_HALDO
MLFESLFDLLSIALNDGGHTILVNDETGLVFGEVVAIKRDVEIAVVDYRSVS